MRCLRFFSLAIIGLALASAGVASGGTVLVGHQGRLLNASDQPVADGIYVVTFSIWTDSIGGTQIWSETQDISTHGGLFSTMLGKLQPLGGDLVIHADEDLYLQTAVSGDPLAPRIRIGTVPHAVSSNSLSSTIPGTGSISTSVGADTTKIDASHQSASGTIDSYVHLLDDRALLGLRLYGPGQAHWGNARWDVSPSKISDYRDMDDDGDSVPDEVMEQAITPGTCSVAIKTKGTGAEANRVITVTADSTTDSTSSGDGSTGTSANMRTRINELETKLQSIGLLARSSSITTLTPGTCSVAIKTKGTGADKNRTISSSTDDTTATHLLDADDDGDGLAERTAWQKVDNTDVITEALVDVDDDGTPDVGTSSKTSIDRVILKSYFERGDKPTASQFSALIDSYAASTTVSVDNNHDGQSEGECKTSSEQNRSYLYTRFENGDIPTEDNIIADTVDPQSARVGLQVTNGTQWSTQSSRCDSDSSGHEVALTYTPPGMLLPALMKAKEKANRTKCSSNLRTINGTNSSESDISCDTAGNATMQLSSTKPSGTSTFNLMTGDGSVIHLFRSSSASSSSATLSADDSGSSLLLTDSTGAASVVIDRKGNIGINEPLPDAPLHHSSGARLTAAGDFVNASSRDLKENFTPVDGEQILEQIEQLPISEWNYKNESDDVKHIGPTAQDFKTAFGVGASDKTISTIDPSGIALAAIKQLKKENNELKQQVDDLKKMVEELAKKK